jgi:iron(III) transport system permease protein
VLYLVGRAVEGSADAAGLILRTHNLVLLGNTLALAFTVVAGSIAIALPLAWLSTCSDLRGRLAVTVLSVIPLAMPGYVVAYGLLSLGSTNGPFEAWFGMSGPRLSGFWGAALTLTIYNFPFMYINLRTAFAERDASLSEAARALGAGPVRRFRHVTLPQLRPGIVAGSMLVGLYVFGDFGVVSLMRYETISYALFVQYLAAFDRVYAAWLALMLITAATVLIFVEMWVLRGVSLARRSGAHRRPYKVFVLGRWRFAAYAFVTVVALLSVGLPNGTVLYWFGKNMQSVDGAGLYRAFADSIAAAAPAALLAVLFAVPIAVLDRRYRSGFSRVMGRAVYVGYATPPLALALGYIFFVLGTAPRLYQSIVVLVAAYIVHFLAQAVGPIRTTLYMATVRLEEASRSLGLGTVATIRRVTLPLMWPGLAGAATLVFLSCIKELPITFLLAPLDFQTLALRVYDYTTEAMFAEAAPYALTIVIVCVGLITALFHRKVEIS